MAVSMKESVRERRPSCSRIPSRRSSVTEIIPPAPTVPPAPSSRRNSDAASPVPSLNPQDRDLRGPRAPTPMPEPEPHKFVTKATETLKPWSPVPLMTAAKQRLSLIGEHFPRAGMRTKTGRPLSVINELDETIDAESRRRMTESMGRNGFEYILLKLWDVSTRLRDAKWKLTDWRAWRYHRSRSTADYPAGTSGHSIVIKEVVSKSEPQSV